VSETYQVLVALGYAIPSFLMAARLWHVWRRPLEVEGGRWVSLGVGIFVLEFILLHAGTFLGGVMVASDSAAGRVGSILLLLLFYGLFVGALTIAFKSREFLTSFLALIGGRLLAILLGASQQDAELLMAHSIIGILIYMAMVVVSLLPLPRFGITEQIADRFRMPGASGAWVDNPHRAIGAATLYFLLLGIAEIGLMTWIDPSRFGR